MSLRLVRRSPPAATASAAGATATARPPARHSARRLQAVALAEVASLGRRLQQLVEVRAVHAATGDLAPLQALCADARAQRDAGAAFCVAIRKDAPVCGGHAPYDLGSSRLRETLKYYPLAAAALLTPSILPSACHTPALLQPWPLLCRCSARRLPRSVVPRQR